ncbi:MAG: S9 family peptidase [Acidobacteriota bacterium]|nr:S9 family peptidase [Acidobacteriota bacterium]
MSTAKRRMPAFVFLSCGLLCACASGAEKRPITETDLYAFQWIADPQISPDGATVVYTHVVVNKKKDGYDTALWMVPAKGGPARHLTDGPRDSGARWSPDGRQIAFSRSVEKNGKPEPAQIFLLSMEGGEARPLTDVPKGASGPAWSPDGKRIAFTSQAVAKDFEKAEKEKADEKSDVRVITRAVYRSNGAGYPEADRAAHIWTVPVPEVLDEPQKARQITFGNFEEQSVFWSRDGAKLFFISNRVPESYYETPDTDLYSVNSDGGSISKLIHIEGTISNAVLSPDGEQIAFVGDLTGKPQRSYSKPDLFVTRVDGGATPKNLTTAYDFDIGGGVGGDQAAPRGGGRSQPFWSADGKSIYTVAAEEGRANLKKVDASTGQVTALTTGDQAVQSYTATQDGTKAAVLISTATNIGDIAVVDVPSGKTTQLTHSNEKLFSQLNVTQPEAIWYKSFDGKRIHAFVQKPPDFSNGKKYPLILNIHGGPHAAYGYTFDHEIQWMAAKGYVVLYPNPRGSTSYGQDFGNIIQYRYPGDDYKDLMAGVDELIRLGWVDPDRMGVTGGSGGGLLTNWVVTQTDRFHAAASQRSIADWRDFWYTADFSLFTPSWFRGAPWKEEADFKARSPITYIERVHTPLMLIEGEADYRTPPSSGGEQMFRALKYLRRPTVMVRFPGESHELSRSGTPRHRVERLQHIVGWMDKYLQGRNVPGYAVTE